MGVGGYSSLTGKARRTQRLARCAAWETQRRVEELEAQDPRVVREDRVIPVRHRAEFMPTAPPEREPSPDDSAAGPTFEQLKLSFARNEAEAALSEDPDLEYAAWAETVAQEAAQKPTPTPAAPAREAIKIAPKHQIAVSSEPAAAPSAPPVVVRPKVSQPSMLPGQLPARAGQPPAGSGHPFTIRGVLLGCALGGIAATLAILLLSAVL